MPDVTWLISLLALVLTIIGGLWVYVQRRLDNHDKKVNEFKVEVHQHFALKQDVREVGQDIKRDLGLVFEKINHLSGEVSRLIGLHQRETDR